MKNRKGLLAMALGTFALGVAEFGMMGILGDVACGVGVSIVKAGHLISFYSAGVAVGAPALVLLHRMPLRRLMVLLAALILLGNLLQASGCCSARDSCRDCPTELFSEPGPSSARASHRKATERRRWR